MGELKVYWQKLLRFLRRGLWEIDPRALSRGRQFILHQAQLAVLVVRDFLADHCMLRASALTYTTLLSIVPLLTLVFSVLKAFGVQKILEPLLLDSIAIGSEEVVSAILRYINNTKVGQLGAVGLIALVVTVLALLVNIEENFNDIWGVKETRSVLRRFSDYFTVVTFGPLFIFVAISMTASLEAQDFVKHLLETAYISQLLILVFKILPYLMMWAAFTFLYLFMPNIKVQLSSALIGGVVGGTLWQLAQWGYVHFQVGVARYNAIYGTLAALPIFMVWIYISWLIVLLGLEITYCSQNLRTIRQEIRGGPVNFASRELVALTVLLVLGRAFNRGERPWTPAHIGEELDLPPRLIREILNELVRLGLLSVTQDERGEGFQPGRDPSTIEVGQVLLALREDGLSYTRQCQRPECRVVQRIEERLTIAQSQVLAGMTMEDLVQEINTEDQAERGGEGSGE